MTETQIVKQILDGLAASRIFAFRLGTGAFFGESAKGKGWKFQAHSLGRGAGDILAFVPFDAGQPYQKDILTYPGITPLWIEVKTATGKQSPEQKTFQEYVEGLGHRYIVARDFFDVQKVICP